MTKGSVTKGSASKGSVTVFQVNDVHYTSKRSDIKIMDRLNVSTKMNQNYGRSFLLAS